MPRITPPDGAVVKYSGLYWHYGHSASGRGIWRAHRTVISNGEALGRAREDTAKADHLLGIWAERGELPEVRAWRVNQAISKLGHFIDPPAAEAFPPLVCLLCGCMVSRTYAATHRTDCKPTAD